MNTLQLTPEQVLATTRSVRKRLDLDRPVERQVLEDCLKLAQQAPRASNMESRRFMVVTDADKRQALAELWRRGMERYLKHGRSAQNGQQASNLLSSVEYLGAHLHEVPVHLIPCVLGRVDGKPLTAQAGIWGTIAPATWSFMLAARDRGLGTCWTTFHLRYEDEAAEILGIPYSEVTQTALIPVAYTTGTDFKPAPRGPLDEVVKWNQW